MSKYTEKQLELLKAKRERDRFTFLSKMRDKLSKLKIKTTGSDVVDETIRKEVGPWR